LRVVRVHAPSNEADYLEARGSGDAVRQCLSRQKRLGALGEIVPVLRRCVVAEVPPRRSGRAGDDVEDWTGMVRPVVGRLSGNALTGSDGLARVHVVDADST